MPKRLPPPPPVEWKLAELAREAGVSPRTVRYYVQRGLLPAPEFRGPDTVYALEHLQRLRAIRHLQDAFLPLDLIQAELARSSPEQLRRLAEGAPTVVAMRRPVPAPPPEPKPRSWNRWELADGLELHLAEDAAASVRQLAERLRRLASPGAAPERGKED